MNKPVYIFAGLTDKAVDSFAEQIRKAKQDGVGTGIVLFFGETLPECGKRVTADKIDEISFAEFIQDIIKREDLPS